MLSINSSSDFERLHSEHREHGWALRAIGQDLANLLPNYLEIEFNGRLYAVRGRGKMKVSSRGKSPVGKLLGKLRASGPAGGEPQPLQFERTYTLQQIHQLGEGGKTRRRNSAQSPDIHFLGERLRAVGKIIETTGGQLIKLTMDEYRVVFKYRDSKGETHEEERTTPELYRDRKNGHLRKFTEKDRDSWKKVRR